jgi:hypothetical protein
MRAATSFRHREAHRFDVAIYPRALGPAEIAENFRAGLVKA